MVNVLGQTFSRRVLTFLPPPPELEFLHVWSSERKEVEVTSSGASSCGSVVVLSEAAFLFSYFRFHLEIIRFTKEKTANSLLLVIFT